MCRIRLPDMMVLVAGIYMITPGKLLIYKKVYGEWQGCMPCTHQHLREHFALPGRPVPIDNSTGRLGVTGGLRRCQVIPTGWLWFSGTKTNSAAVIQYRFPDNLSAAKVFFVQGSYPTDSDTLPINQCPICPSTAPVLPGH